MFIHIDKNMALSLTCLSCLYIFVFEFYFLHANILCYDVFHNSSLSSTVFCMDNIYHLNILKLSQILCHE